MRIGIDLGGTKTEIIALDDNGEMCLRERITTPALSYQEIVDSLQQLVLDAEKRLGAPATVGIGIPGAISPKTGVVKNANTVCLIGKPFQQDLERALARPIRLANDANCFALSEASDGAAAGAGVVFGVILGTGVGGGIVINGKVLVGPNAIAGEWGHNPIPWPRNEERPGPACYCGQRGCIETFLSGPGLKNDHFIYSKKELSPQEIVTSSESGDIDATTALQIYEHRLARALASVMNILDPDVIVLGGGLSNVSRFYENVPQLWRGYVFSDHVETKLVKAKHGDSSGVRGAAWLWP